MLKHILRLLKRETSMKGLRIIEEVMTNIRSLSCEDYFK